jgi:hypothetical protein
LTQSHSSWQEEEQRCAEYVPLLLSVHSSGVTSPLQLTYPLPEPGHVATPNGKGAWEM